MLPNFSCLSHTVSFSLVISPCLIVISLIDFTLMYVFIAYKRIYGVDRTCYVGVSQGYSVTRTDSYKSFLHPHTPDIWLHGTNRGPNRSIYGVVRASHLVVSRGFWKTVFHSYKGQLLSSLGKMRQNPPRPVCCYNILL